MSQRERRSVDGHGSSSTDTKAKRPRTDFSKKYKFKKGPPLNSGINQEQDFSGMMSPTYQLSNTKKTPLNLGWGKSRTGFLRDDEPHVPTVKHRENPYIMETGAVKLDYYDVCCQLAILNECCDWLFSQQGYQGSVIPDN